MNTVSRKICYCKHFKEYMYKLMFTNIILNSSIYSTVDYQRFRSDEKLTILV